jgi:hypothetical protein
MYKLKNSKYKTNKKYLLFILPVLLSLIISLSPKEVYATSITISPTSGGIGSIVQIDGEDFSGRIGMVYFDDKVIAKDILISETGKLNCSITIPTASKGSHTIKITDNSNWSGSTASASFTISSGISVYPSATMFNSTFMVSGYGFGANESGIKVAIDGTPVNMPAITADRIGTWSSSIQSNISKGKHTISAYGSTTTSESISPLSVVVYPWATMDPLIGPVGTKIIVKAWGFRTNEDGVTLTWDGDIILTNIRAEVDGTVILDGSKRQFNVSFDNDYRESLIVPPSTEGKHKIVLYGSSFTPKGTYPDFYFQVTPSIQVEPVQMANAIQLNVNGFGFAKDENIEIFYDNASLQKSVADATGSFSATIGVPSTGGKDHVIQAKGTRNSAEAKFSSGSAGVQLLPPQLKTPAANTEIAVFSSVGDIYLSSIKYLFGLFDYLNGTYSVNTQKAVATFSWINTEPINDTSYDVQISTKSNFSTIILEKQVKNVTSVNLTPADSLPTGTYYWRVRSLDTKNNVSEWSAANKFSIATMPGIVSALSIIIFILIIAAIIFAIMMLWINSTRRY